MPLEHLDSLVRSGTRRRLWEISDASHQVNLGKPEIERLIPHRDPFLFVDTITAVDLQCSKIRGSRTIPENDPVFLGHFPGQPIYPGVLLLETMGQFGLCLLHFTSRQILAVPPEIQPRDIRAVRIHHAAFLQEAGPGQCLEVTASLVTANDYTAICAGQITIGENICAFGLMEVYFVE